MRPLLKAMLCLALGAPLMGLANPAAPTTEAAPSTASKVTAEQFLAGLRFQQGKIALPGDIATLDLPSTFRYLGPEDAAKVLVQGWGNPPGTKTLGMILPANVNPLSEAGWGVVVTYDKDGHVKDDDAGKIDYTDLLKDMKDGMEALNSKRKEQGYTPMYLVGWAEPPSYNQAQHKLYWAKELHTDGDQENGLNYNIRVLGREGVLVLNAVAGMNQISQVRSEMAHVTTFTDFTPGNRYTDFNDKTDKVAEYGIAALVAGGIAAKLGFFGKLFALLLAFKKVILIALAAGGSWIYKLFGAKKGKPAVDLSKRD